MQQFTVLAPCQGLLVKDSHLVEILSGRCRSTRMARAAPITSILLAEDITAIASDCADTRTLHQQSSMATPMRGEKVPIGLVLGGNTNKMKCQVQEGKMGRIFADATMKRGYDDDLILAKGENKVGATWIRTDARPMDCAETKLVPEITESAMHLDTVSGLRAVNMVELHDLNLNGVNL